LAEENVIEKMKGLIGKGKYKKAIKVVLSKGKVVRKMSERENHQIYSQDYAWIKGTKWNWRYCGSRRISLY